MSGIKSVLCIGAGRVGAATTIALANKCPSIKFTVFDDDIDRISTWSSGTCPFFEPGLKSLLNDVLGKNLFFTHDLQRAIEESEVVFVSLNTPTKTFGEGAGRAPDLTGWENAARRIAKHANGSKIIVESSTIPVRTGEAMRRVLDAQERGFSFEVVCFPSFIRGSSAVADLENPERILIGSDSTESGQAAAEKIISLFSWVPREKIVTTNLWSAELSKLALNAYVACRISSTNAVSALCEETGAQLSEVMGAVGADSRLGNAFLHPCPGFGGACLRQNLLTLVYLCQHFGLAEVAEFWEHVLAMNEYQKTRFSRTILREMASVQNKNIAVLGFAYKKGTNDTRESPASDICRALAEERANLRIYDPQVTRTAILGELKDTPVPAEVCPSAKEACQGAHAVIVLTEWDEFRDLPWAELYASMEKPAHVFDSRDILPAAALRGLGFHVYTIGRPPPATTATTAPFGATA